MLQLQIKTNTTDIISAKNLIQSAIESEIKRLQRSLEKTNQILNTFETKYHISSEDFLTNGTAEDLEGEDEEYITWIGEFKIKQKLTESLQKLETIEYVT